MPILIGTFFTPESPWWLVRHGRPEEAKKSILALTSRDCGVPFNADDQVILIKATNELEAAITEGTSYWDCFRGIDLRRTEIASMSWLTQSWCGTVLAAYAVQFFQRAGLSNEHAFDLNLGNAGMAGVGTIGSWFLMTYIGRRKLYLAGLITLFTFLIIIGGLGTKPASTSVSWAIGSLMLISTFIYGFTIGPVCYSLVAEIPSTRLRIKTVVLARNFYNMVMPPLFGLHSYSTLCTDYCLARAASSTTS